MKIVNLIKSFFVALFLLVINTGCVHDDDYSTAPIVCQDLTPTTTIAQLKALYSGNTKQITEDLVLVGYVSSSDETGNIYKTLYIQDAPENPTHGLTVSVDAADLYTKFPLGAKVYIKLKGLYLGQYGGVVQLGDVGVDENGAVSFGRIPNAKIDGTIIKSCDPVKTIVPKELSINQFNDNLIGALIKINEVEFARGIRCSTYAVEGVTVNKLVIAAGFDYSKPTTDDANRGKSFILRNSGYATFYNLPLPTGNGSLVGVLSKYESDYQVYIRSTDDTKEMTGARKDGVIRDCSYLPTDNSSVKEIKSLLSGDLTKINSDKNITVTVTANDESGNFYKYIYVEDETGGIRLRLNTTNLYKYPMFQVGRQITIQCKDLYVGLGDGEIQLGSIFNNKIGNIEDYEVFNYVFDNKTNAPITPKTLTINSITTDDIGRLIKFENVEFIDSDTGVVFAGTSNTNRTLKDCSNNRIILRTSSFASFKSDLTPSGNGTFIGILNVFNGTNQVWVRHPLELDMKKEKCDGTPLFFEDFTKGLDNWTAVSVSGAQVWGTSNQGTGSNYYAVMNGFSGGAKENEDWLISKEISLTGYATYSLNFDSDVRYNGNVLEVYVTENYTNNPSTTIWTKLNATLDTNSGAFGFANSGNIDLSSYAGKNIRLAYKYISTNSAASTWEVDNVKIAGKK